MLEDLKQINKGSVSKAVLIELWTKISNIALLQNTSQMD
jgi:hypothetical protein